MIRRRVPLALALLPLLALPAAAQIPIGGRVLDDRGAPLAGAEVALVRYPAFAERLRLELAGKADLDPAATTKSGADGRFRLAAPEQGMWKVRVTARGFVPREHPLYPLFEATELPDAKLPRDAGFTARVLDPAGRPLAGARVSIGEREARVPSADPWRTAWRRATTDEQGRAALPRLDGEELRLWAVAPGQLAAELDAEGASLDVRLGAGCARTVEVREPGGRPAAGAFIEAASWALGTAGESGRLAITAPCGSAIAVSVTAADGRRATADLKPASQGAKLGEPPPLAVTLPKQPVRLAGRVLEQGTRAPVGDAFVWPGEPGDAVRTDAEGRYALVVNPGAPGERSWLSAETGRHLRATEQTPPAPAGGGEAAGATFALVPAAVIAGTVVDEAGRPVAGAELRATAVAQRFPFPRAQAGSFTRSDAAGRFRLWLTAGTAHDLSASHPDYTAGRLAVPTLAPHEARTDLSVVLARGVDAFGRVVDSAERPVAGATVRLMAAPVAAASGPDAIFARLTSDEQAPEATTGAEGRFGFPHLAPGRFDLTVRAAGFAPITVRGVEVPQGGAAADLGTVILGPGATVEGRVVDRRGGPIPGASVFFQTTGGGRLTRSRRLLEGSEPQATTDADGRFALVDLAPGERIALTIVKPGYAEATLPGVEVPPARLVEVVLAAAARLSGRVLDPDREPIAEAGVLLFKERSGMMLGDVMMRGQMAGNATTDAEGRFTLADLKPGTMTLDVQARGFVSAERAGLQVREGEDRTGLEDRSRTRGGDHRPRPRR